MEGGGGEGGSYGAARSYKLWAPDGVTPSLSGVTSLPELTNLKPFLHVW